MRGFPILILILRGQNQDVGGKESVPTNFADDIYWRIGIMREMVNIPMVVIILFRNVEYNENWYQDSYKASYLGINSRLCFLE